MKKTIITLLLTISLIISGSALFAQAGPPDPPEDPNAGGGPVGGSAPLGSGITLLLALGATYGGRKVYLAWKDQQDQES